MLMLTLLVLDLADSSFPNAPKPSLSNCMGPTSTLIAMHVLSVCRKALSSSPSTAPVIILFLSTLMLFSRIRAARPSLSSSVALALALMLCSSTSKFLLFACSRATRILCRLSSISVNFTMFMASIMISWSLSTPRFSHFERFSAIMPLEHFSIAFFKSIFAMFLSSSSSTSLASSMTSSFTSSPSSSILAKPSLKLSAFLLLIPSIIWRSRSFFCKPLSCFLASCKSIVSTSVRSLASLMMNAFAFLNLSPSPADLASTAECTRRLPFLVFVFLSLDTA
mmetsp:Transcript_20934/g.43690  ORF Transcript_20934/g.43690 Transcript_20934/m.43690 type:complete len:280 (-) Transcript_20934:5029-5868(-)